MCERGECVCVWGGGDVEVGSGRERSNMTC